MNVRKNRIPEARKLGCWCHLALLALVLALNPALRAQDDTPKNGVLEIGVRGLAGDRASSQFNEYRDIQPVLFVQLFQTDLEHLFGRNYFLTFQTRYSAQKDKRFYATFGDTGKF